MKWSKKTQLEFHFQEDKTITITKSHIQCDYLNILSFVWETIFILQQKVFEVFEFGLLQISKSLKATERMYQYCKLL